MIAAAASCALCGLPIAGAPLEQTFGADRQPFCCPGCLNVYAILHESGVVARGVDLRGTALFRESLARGLVAAVSKAAVPARAAVPEDAPAVDALFRLSGLWCGSCAWLIERVLSAEPGIRRADVLFASDLLKVTWCPQYVKPDRIPALLAGFGYQATPWTGDTDGDGAERRALALRLGVSVFLWLNVMMLNLAVYVGYFQETPASIRRVLPWVLMALSAPVVFYGGWPVLRLAAGALRHRLVRMETLLALGILSAWGFSVVETVRGGPHIYFDTASAIVVFVLAGKSIERAARERSARAITQLHRLLPRKARLLAVGVERLVPIETLRPGQVILVRAGERIPCDGVVTSGRSHVDEALLTGEAEPRSKAPGAPVAGGSLNVDTPLEIRVTRTGEDSALAHAVQLVEAALAGRSRLERAVDRVSRAFVPAVIVLAAATCGAWWTAGELPFADALLRGITVLVIACPCALGIATPLALTAAVGAASRRGILVGHSAALETIRRLDVVVFDKTGTVTESELALVAVSGAALPALAALERYSEHPFGRAVVRAAEAAGAAAPAASDVHVEKGVGITGVVAGRRVAIGSRRLFGAIDPEVARAAAAHAEQGHSVAFHGDPSCATGLMAFGNRLVPEASAVVEALQARGIRTVLLSGDDPATVARIAAELGVADYRAGQSPAQKLEAIDELKATGATVAMVGDGINDAPALARADLGIAVSSGTDLAMKAAAVVLVRRDLRGLLDAIDLAQRTFRIVRQNLFWAFAYNTAGLALAVAGALHPIAAAAGMVLSSVSVTGNSFRLTAAPRGHRRR